MYQHNPTSLNDAMQFVPSSMGDALLEQANANKRSATLDPISFLYDSNRHVNQDKELHEESLIPATNRNNLCEQAFEIPRAASTTVKVKQNSKMHQGVLPLACMKSTLGNRIYFSQSFIDASVNHFLFAERDAEALINKEPFLRLNNNDKDLGLAETTAVCLGQLIALKNKAVSKKSNHAFNYLADYLDVSHDWILNAAMNSG